MIDRALSMALFFWASWGALVVGFAYFIGSPKNISLSARLATSAFAPSTALVFLASLFLPRQTWLSASQPVYLWVQVLLAALAIVAIKYFKGPRYFHFILLPIAALCWAWQAMIGYFAIYGK